MFQYLKQIHRDDEETEDLSEHDFSGGCILVLEYTEGWNRSQLYQCGSESSIRLGYSLENQITRV